MNVNAHAKITHEVYHEQSITNKLSQITATVILHISSLLYVQIGKVRFVLSTTTLLLSVGIAIASISKYCRDLPVFNNIDHWRTPSNSQLLEKYGYHISLWVRDIIKDELLFFNTSK